MLSIGLDSNRSVLGLDFIAKQRSGFGLEYMSFALMQGNNPRTSL